MKNAVKFAGMQERRKIAGFPSSVDEVHQQKIKNVFFRIINVLLPLIKF